MSEPVKEIYCENCADFKPLIEEDPTVDDLNEYAWGDLLCGECKLIIATIRIRG